MNLGDILKNILKFAFSWGGHKMNDDVKKLQDTINSIITRPDRQPGYHGTTWCIVAAWEILKILGYDVDGLVDQRTDGAGVFYTTPDEMAQRARNLSLVGFCCEVTERIAQDLANLGVGVIACSFHLADKAGHDAVAAPGVYTETDGCTVGQAGGVNGVFSRRKGFGAPNTLVTMPKFYVFPKKAQS
jgi:hypothetical protein